MTSQLQSVPAPASADLLEADGAPAPLTTLDRPRRTVNPRQAELRERLVHTIRQALPLVYRAERATEGAERAYRSVAHVLVELRHQFVTSDGCTPDLRGRSRGYRAIVRFAYVEAGAASDGPVEKRLSAGVSYWVRKILIDRYGEDRLRELGVLPHSAPDALHKLLADGRVEDPGECMATVAGLLNVLASDSSFTPTEELVRSAARALALMQARINRSFAAD